LESSFRRDSKGKAYATSAVKQFRYLLAATRPSGGGGRRFDIATGALPAGRGGRIFWETTSVYPIVVIDGTQVAI